MVQIQSTRLGAIEITPEEILEFPNGVPGFPGYHRFILIDKPGFSPILFLQCVDAPGVCFLAAPLTAIDAHYDLAVAPEDLLTLGLDEHRQPIVDQEIVCLALLAAPENGRWAANLLAPILIDPHSRRAVQAVRMDSRYSHQHPIGPEEAPCS